MKLYSLSNPSDPITFEASSDAVAGLVGLVLGQGKCPVYDEDDKTVLPFLMFGGPDALDVWLKEAGIGTVDELPAFKEREKTNLISAMRSTMVCDLPDRKRLREAYGSDPPDLATYNEKARTSMSDFCGYARDAADAWEKEGVP